MLKLFPPVLLGIFLMASASAQAKPKFIASEVAGKSSELMICDLDGDGLKDFVLREDFNLSIFYQDSKRGFTRDPQQTHSLEPRPSVVWTAKSGGQGSLFVMTSDGVTEFSFTNRTGSPVIRQIIRQPTLIPNTAEKTNAMELLLSVETGGDWPLLLVPTANGLQVWQLRDEWVKAQDIDHGINVRQWPSLANSEYSISFGFKFNFGVGDCNNDRRDDLIVTENVGRTLTYRLYLQQTNGLFASEPVLSYPDNAELRSWLCWLDLNRDGKMDLIKSFGVNEPSFVPGVPSDKAVVSAYIADQHGRIPAEPQQVFRKNDFTVALPVVDVDGDGFLDLVLFNRHMDNREAVAKMVTTKQLDYTLRFYFYRAGMGFSKEAACQRDVIFRLDRAELMGWIGTENYDIFVKLVGDFSGDGKTDLVVREHDNEISVYFFISREKGFSLKPDLRFSSPEEIDDWEARDLNNDGVNDLIVKLRKQNAYRIFISQK